MICTTQNINVIPRLNSSVRSVGVYRKIAGTRSSNENSKKKQGYPTKVKTHMATGKRILRRR